MDFFTFFTTKGTGCVAEQPASFGGCGKGCSGAAWPARCGSAAVPEDTGRTAEREAEDDAGLGTGAGVRGCRLVFTCISEREDGEVGEEKFGAFGSLGWFGFSVFFAELRLPEPQDPWEGKTVEWHE